MVSSRKVSRSSCAESRYSSGLPSCAGCERIGNSPLSSSARDEEEAEIEEEEDDPDVFDSIRVYQFDESSVYLLSQITR